ncbi:MAG: 3'(2'),5'-bisphosphate nucleotidase CysQ [Gammaproteobacteria bacterium]|nr:3'(2'),5'-bisphosphate nucleotidase CysQ [Gammaproteobacteria bacterium]
MTLEYMLDEIVALARKAGERIMEVYTSNDFHVEQKSDNSPLTLADKAAHSVIVAGLERLNTKYPVLSEESTAIPFTERAAWDRYWLVDPLDGTREFIKRNGEFTVNIALIDKHRPLLGVVYVPVSGVCYYALEGLGAFKCLADQAPRPIAARSCPESGLTIAGSRSHSNEKFQKLIRCLGENTAVLNIGSSLKICMVAEGKADLYPRLGLTSEWDTAAAQCVAEQAGAHITDLERRPLRYNTKDSLLNPHFLVFGEYTGKWSDCLNSLEG